MDSPTMIRIIVIFSILAVAIAAPGHRIVNGTDAEEGQYPYVISLRNGGDFHSCGGSIINNRWVLTAAHCVRSPDPKLYTVQYGVTKISPQGSTISKVEKIVSNDYDEFDSHRNDIALLKLTDELKFNKYVQPVKLPKSNVQTPDGANCTLVGWGVDEKYDDPEVLQQLHYYIVGYKECNATHDANIYETQVCAVFPGYGKAQCSGDSGGPLTVDGVQVGIVSWSIKPCGVAKYPGVFTQVSFYRDWIKEHTGS